MSDTKISKRIRLSTVAYAASAVILLFFAASLVMAYALPRSGAIVKRFADASPYPIAVIGYRDGFSFRTLAENMASIRRFYEAQDFSQVGLRVDFSTDEGEKRLKVREKEVLNKMLEDEAIRRLARERGIIVGQEAADQEVSRKLAENGSADKVKEDLDRLYGWTLDDFERKVVVPSLYEEKLRASFEKEADTASRAEGVIRAAQEALRKGKSFDETAKRYSEGQTGKDGGDLGWFALDDLAPELRAPVMSQKAGVPGEIVGSELGFHIVLVEETKKEEGKQLYRLKQIFARKVTFADWLSERMKNLSVFVLSPEYRWNADEARAEFKDQEMKNFEKELYEKSSGDAMFFF